MAGREIYKLQNIQRFIKANIKRQRVPSLDEVEERRTEAMFERLRETLDAGQYRRQDAALDRLLEAGFSPTDIASALVHLLADGGTKPAAPAGNTVEGPSAKSSPPPVPGAVVDGTRGGPRTSQRTQGPPGGPPAADDREARPKPSHKGPNADRPASAASHEAGMTRLMFNVGEKHDIRPGDIVGVIAGVTRLGKEAVGAINILPGRSLVDVVSEHEGTVREKLNGIRFKGRKLLVELAAH